MTAIIQRKALPEFGPIGLRQHIGAKANGTPDDGAIAEWLAAGMERKQPLHADYGDYTCLEAVTIDLTGRRQRALIVTGDGRGNTRFYVDKVKHVVQFQIIVSHGEDDRPGEEVSAFKSQFSGFDICGKLDGPVAQLGRDDFNDALNTFKFTDIGIDNCAVSKKNEALRINHVLNSDIAVMANCYSRPNKNNLGVALHLRHSCFNNFWGSLCNADIGTLLSGGDSFSNEFNNIDYEEGNTAVVIDTPQARNNTWYSGQMAYRDGVDAKAGENNRWISPNEALRTERYDRRGNVVGCDKGSLLVHDIGFRFESLLNAHDQAYRPKLPRRAHLKLAA